jgi:hypothetical protein
MPRLLNKIDGNKLKITILVEIVYPYIKMTFDKNEALRDLPSIPEGHPFIYHYQMAKISLPITKLLALIKNFVI